MKKQKVMNYKPLLTAMVLAVCSLTLSGQMITDNRTFKKGFRAGTRPVLDVSNKYGNLHISHSESDSIIIRAEVTASSNDETRLNRMMSDVDISMTMTNETVRAQTILGKNVITLFESFKGLTKSIINYESRLKIDYYIECPPSTILRLSNSYGDVYLGDETAELSLTLANGSLDAGRIRNALSLDLTFCKADIRAVENGRVSASFGELTIREIKDINLITRSMKIRIEEADELNLDSKRDVISIRSAGTITGATYFTDLNADRLNNEISLVTKYGNLSFEEVSGNFSLIDVSSSYTDLDFSITAGASYNLEIHHTNAFVSLPGVSPEPEVTEISAENKVFLTTARVGAMPERTRIRIEAVKGEIRLLQK